MSSLAASRISSRFVGDVRATHCALTPLLALRGDRLTSRCGPGQGSSMTTCWPSWLRAVRLSAKVDSSECVKFIARTHLVLVSSADHRGATGGRMWVMVDDNCGRGLS